jgi:hypothetical protein
MSAIPAEPRHGCDITDRAWHDSYVPVVFLIAIVVVLVGVFFAATGRGGELAYEQADQAPLDLGPVSSADIALLRPPTALWGYNMQATDAALDQIARAMRDRDVTIAYLQEQLSSYEHGGSYADPQGADLGPGQQAQDVPAAGGGPDFPDTAQLPGTAEFRDADEPPGIVPAFPLAGLSILEPRDPAEAPSPAESPETLEFTETLGPPETPEAPDTFGPPETPEAALREDEQPHDLAHPAAAGADDAPAAEDGPGPQGAFDTHGWWAEQEEAAREEQAQRRPGTGQGDDLAAVEEQGW